MASSSLETGGGRGRAAQGHGKHGLYASGVLGVRDPFEVQSVLQLNAMGPKNWIFQKWSIDTRPKTVVEGITRHFSSVGRNTRKRLIYFMRWKTVRF